jgi:hypothetical protein
LPAIVAEQRVVITPAIGIPGSDAQAAIDRAVKIPEIVMMVSRPDEERR